MGLYETLKAAKLGAAPDVLTTLRAQIAPFAKGGSTPTEKELEDTPPLSFTGNGDLITVWTVKGNVQQSGTPNYLSPAIPTGCGNLVESGEHIGEYIIPIQCGGSTTNIYVAEPLRKVKEYSDYISQNEEYRAIAEIELTGDETWNETGSGASRFFFTSIAGSKRGVTEVCSHFSRVQTPATGSTMRIYDVSAWEDTSEFVEWLVEQKSNGTPVKIWYILTNPVTTSVSATSIPTVNGSNTLSVGTTVQPSSVYIKYKE